VGWFFVPFANLVKPCTVVGEIEASSRGQIDGRYPKPSPLILVWWLANIFGNIIASVAGKLTGDETVLGNSPAYVAFTVGLVLAIIGTAAFSKIVRNIHRYQSATISVRLRYSDPYAALMFWRGNPVWQPMRDYA
jgi:hypothetical protein